LVDGVFHPPTEKVDARYHAARTTPDAVFATGLRGKGEDEDFVAYVQGRNPFTTAFRGTAAIALGVGGQIGAGNFLESTTDSDGRPVIGVVGYAYKISGVPGWDVNKLSQQLGFSAFTEEAEVAISARVEPQHIEGYYPIRQTLTGLKLGAFVSNPGYQHP